MTYAGLRALTHASIVAIVVSACSGSHGGSLAVPTAGQPQTPQSVELKIDVPAASSAAARHSLYISPATTQLMVNIQSGCPGSCASISGYPTTVALTPTSNGCTSTLASTQCVLKLSLLPGTYVGTFTTLDAADATLSTAQSVAITIVAGTANVIAISLAGVPASLVASSLGNGAFLVTALDSDNNAIVGPGAPTFAIARTGGNALTITQPTTTSPNIFHASITSAGTTTISVTASYSNGTNACTQSGAQCARTFTLTSSIASTLIAADTQKTDVVQFAEPFTGAATATTTSGLSTPEEGVLNAAGNLFVINGGGVNIAEFASPYTGAATTTISSGITYATAMAFDSAGNLFVVNQENSLLEFAPPYTGTPTTLGVTGLDQAEDIAIDASDNIFVANLAGTVVEYTKPYGAPASSLSVGNNPIALAVDANDNVFVGTYAGAESGGGTLVESAPFGQPATTIASGLTTVKGVVLDPAGNVYVSQSSPDTISVAAPPYMSGLTTVRSDFQNVWRLSMHNVMTTTIQ
jgi:hypothetical protein